MKKNSSATFQMRMPEVIKQMGKAQAKRQGVSLSRWVQMLIERENARL